VLVVVLLFKTVCRRQSSQAPVVRKRALPDWVALPLPAPAAAARVFAVSVAADELHVVAFTSSDVRSLPSRSTYCSTRNRPSM